MTQSTKPVAVVLGGTAPHAALIDALRARGYYTVLVDYYADPPAKSHADKHVCESTLDRDLVVQIARDHNAALVIATCVDQANTIAVYAAEQLGLPHPYSFEAASVIADKTRMKERLVAHGLPTARHILVETGQVPDVAHLRYPLVVKPADTNGSAGVRRVNDAEELARFLALALGLSRVGRAIIEEFVTGPELSIDCFIEAGHAKIVLVRHKYAVPAGSGVEQVMQSTGSIAPYILTPAQLENAESVLSDLARVFELDNCPMLVQGFLTQDGLSLIEFAARLSGGTGAATTKLISGFDALEASIDSFLGIPVQVQTHAPAFYAMTTTLYAHPGTFERIEGIEPLIADGTIDRFLPYKTKGMTIGNDMSTKSRIGALIITGPNPQTVQQKLQKTAKNIKVLNTQHKNILKTNLMKTDGMDAAVQPKGSKP